MRCRDVDLPPERCLQGVGDLGDRGLLIGVEPCAPPASAAGCGAAGTGPTGTLLELSH
jgi:hypothetical protein